MAYTAQALITEAWYISGIVARNLETVSSAQIFDGLERLNAVLAITASNTALVPYHMEYNSVFVPGQELYYIPNLVEIQSVTFTIPTADDPTNTVRYPMMEATREQYFAYARVNNINSLPYQWHLERVNDGSNLYVYYLPQSNWNFQVWGKFLLQGVELNTDMTLTNQAFYIEYLKYMLAKYLCQLYNVRFPMDKQETLDSYIKCIRNVSPVDFTQKSMSWFRPGGAPNYADANLAHGWTVL